ncbi:MAG: YihY/virulence factor BrkB family protein, partial [Candidatus Hydrogenedentes bacterium]|nr:YihY/virulence factor BrkB family protein [Candidatus Hydrogenedentota bacterium]
MDLRRRLQQLLEALRRGQHFVTHDVWHVGAPGERIPSGFISKQVRVTILLLRGIYEETLLLRASALTFATMLFIVPFLAFMFSFIQTFNLGDEIYGLLSEKVDQQLARVVRMIRVGDTEAPREGAEVQESPAEAAPDQQAGVGETPPAPQTPETAVPAPTPDQTPAAAAPPAAAQGQVNEKLWQDLISLLFPGWEPEESEANPVQMLVSAAERGATNRQALTIGGIIYVLTTVLGLMRNVEWSFNRIWGVGRSRDLRRTISDYLMITLLLPFVAAGVVGITAALQSENVVAELGPLATALYGGQIAVICLTFSLLYWLVPNTRVEVKYALLGGIVAGVLWIILSQAYIKFQIGLVRYEIFFSTFALFPLLLMYVYSSWVILLFGALVTFAYQNEKTFAVERLADRASYAYREAIAVRAMIEMTRRFRRGLPGLTITEAAEAWNVPTRLLNETMEILIQGKMAVPIAGEPVAYQPARSPETAVPAPTPDQTPAAAAP